MSDTAYDAFKKMESFHFSGEPFRATAIESAFNALDFEIRFLTLVTISTLRAEGVASLKISRSPGLGEMLGILRKAKSHLGEDLRTHTTHVKSATQAVLTLFQQGIPGAPPGIHDIKSLRDYVSHGGPLPSDNILPYLNDLIESISKENRNLVASVGVAYSGNSDGERQPSLVRRGEPVNLWPLILISHDGSWCLYARSTVNGPKYYHYNVGGGMYSAGSQSTAALEKFLLTPNKRSTLSEFSALVKRDLVGFAEIDAEPVFFDHNQGFSYQWDRATSDRTERRLDNFRLGTEDRKEWEERPEVWVGYSTFLRTISNWRTVAARLRQILDQTESLLAEEERDLLGWSIESQGDHETRVVVSDMDNTNKENLTFTELIGGVDKSLESNIGQARVVFINGEAGSGKTKAMINAARQRAAKIEKSADPYLEGLPLFLYVKATGRVLDKLDDAVNAAVTRTRNLTDEGVKALCRNGLMTLLIDGFDELLGGATYSDALGTLRPWLKEVGGRGVLVISARSSYYVNQYRASVSRLADSEIGDIRHRIAEMQRWSEDEIISFIGIHGIQSEEIFKLSNKDRKLLGLPFFARAFIEYWPSMQRESPTRPATLTEYLVDQYIVREEHKFPQQENKALVGREELKRIFEVAAEFMASSDERELELADLEVAAALALNEDLGARPGLKQRVTALCGLAVSTASQNAPRFRFQHELYFDQFLAGAAAYYLQSSETPAFHAMLQRSYWRSATVTRVVARAGIDSIIDALHSLDYGQMGFLRESEREVLSANLGSLWVEVFRETGKIPKQTIEGASFPDLLDLSDVELASARFIGCDIGFLVLPKSGQWHISLTNTLVRKIRSPRVDLSGLEGVIHKELIELSVPGELFERRTEILDALRKRGAKIGDDESSELDEVLDTNFKDAAHYYLINLQERAQNSIIVRARDYRPVEDDRIKWTKAYDSEAWRKFVKSLLDSGLATKKRFDAQGEAKTRIRLRYGASSILEKDASVPEIALFWATLSP